MYNLDFKVVEFDRLKSKAGLHTFTLSAKKTPPLPPSRISEISHLSLIDCPFQSGNPQRRNEFAQNSGYIKKITPFEVTSSRATNSGLAWWGR